MVSRGKRGGRDAKIQTEKGAKDVRAKAMPSREREEEKGSIW